MDVLSVIDGRDPLRSRLRKSPLFDPARTCQPVVGRIPRPDADRHRGRPDPARTCQPVVGRIPRPDADRHRGRPDPARTCQPVVGRIPPAKMWLNDRTYPVGVALDRPEADCQGDAQGHDHQEADPQGDSWPAPRQPRRGRGEGAGDPPILGMCDQRGEFSKPGCGASFIHLRSPLSTYPPCVATPCDARCQYGSAVGSAGPAAIRGRAAPIAPTFQRRSMHPTVVATGDGHIALELRAR